MAKKRDYWSRKPIMATGADIMMIYGQNCAGKSYQVKEECIETAMRGERFFYLRRMVTEVNQTKAALYFDDMPVKQMTGGEWDGITAYQGMFFFYRINEKGEKEKSEYIGAYDSVYNWQKIKSVAWVDFTVIDFEEFISAGVYLDDEPTKLMRCITAIFRDHKGKVFMLGNTISRVVPYFQEWTPNVPKQKQGTIELYHMHDEAGEGNEITIAVEYGGHIKGTGPMFFGQASKAIVAGEWDVTDRPKLPKDYIDYEMVYELALEYQTFAFVLQLLVDPEEGTKLLYVYPRTKKRKIERLITDKFSDDIMTTRYFKDNKAESYMVECIDNNKVVYSDNLTGNDFANVIELLKL